MHRPSLLRWLSGIFTAVLLLGGVVLFIAYWFSFREVTFEINDQRQTLRLRAHTVGEALNAAHISIHPQDAVQPAALETPLEDPALITILQAQQLAIQEGGSATRHYTRLTAPMDILAEAAGELTANDEVLLNGLPMPRFLNTPLELRTIHIKRSVTVTIVDEGVSRSLASTADSVAGALRESGITLYLADSVQPPLHSPLEPELTIEIQRSQQITLQMDGESFSTRAYGEHVGDILPQLGIVLTGQDYLIPGEGSPLEDGMQIRVVRVRDEIELQQRPLPYATLRQMDSDLRPGEERVVQAGRDGLQEERLRVRYEDGREVSRVVLESTVLEPAIDEIIAYGQLGGKDE